MSYGLGVILQDSSDYPPGMYITTDDPMRTIRTAYYNDGPILIFGGDSHELDEDNYNPDPSTQVESGLWLLSRER